MKELAVWIVSNGGDGVRLELDGQELIAADFSGTDLRGSAIRNCNLVGASFEEAELMLADLSGSDISRGNFVQASLLGTVLRGTTLIGANFRSAKLQQAEIYGADHKKTGRSIPVVVMDSDLSEADFSGAVVDGVDFTRCNTEGAKLKQGKLVNCKGVD